mgnify:FL=1
MNDNTNLEEDDSENEDFGGDDDEEDVNLDVSSTQIRT